MVRFIDGLENFNISSCTRPMLMSGMKLRVLTDHSSKPKLNTLKIFNWMLLLQNILMAIVAYFFSKIKYFFYFLFS